MLHRGGGLEGVGGAFERLLAQLPRLRWQRERGGQPGDQSQDRLVNGSGFFAHVSELASSCRSGVLLVRGCVAELEQVECLRLSFVLLLGVALGCLMICDAYGGWEIAMLMVAWQLVSFGLLRCHVN